MKTNLTRRKFLQCGILAGVGLLSASCSKICWIKPDRIISSTVGLRDRLSSELLTRVLNTALARGGEFAELFAEYTIESTIVLQEDMIKNLQYGIVQGAGIRVISGEKTGYAYSDEFDETKLIDAAKVASYIAKNNLNLVTLPVSVVTSAPEYSQVSILPCTVPELQKINIIQRANKTAREYDTKVKQVTVNYYDIQRNILIANSDGLLIEDEQILVSLFVSVLAIHNGLRQSGYDFGGGRYGIEAFNIKTPEQIASEAARKAILKLDAVPPPAGQHTVVIGNGSGGILVHEAVGHGLEADHVRKAESVYTGKLGEQVASPLVTIVDDATLPHCRGTIDIDDEGTIGQRKVLIENGRLCNYMYDKLSGKLMNRSSTGNGRRQSYKHFPMPRMTNIFIDNGETDPSEIIQSVKKGVYVKSIGGGSVDTTSGDFVFSIDEAYLIENNKVTAPIRDATLVGNGPDVMKKVVMVGNDILIERAKGSCGKSGQRVPAGFGQPTLKITQMTIGGTV